MKLFKGVRTAAILQMEAAECGAAALGIVLAYFGRHEPLAKLRVACGVSRDGSKASNILAAARGYGLKAQAFRVEPEDLRTLPQPSIIYWNFNHFIVVEKAGRHTVRINDPASGRRNISWREFDEGFTGIVLIFDKDAGFQKGGKRKTVLASVRERLASHRAALAYVLLATLALAIPVMVASSLPAVVIDNMLLGGMRQWQRPLLLAFGGAITLLALINWLQRAALLRLQIGLAVSGAGRFVWHLLRLPVDFFAQRARSEVALRVTANEQLAELVSGELATALAGVLTAGVFLALLYRYDAFLTLIVVVTSLLNVAVLQMVARRRSDLNQLVVQERSKLMAASVGGLLSMESLKAMGSEPDFFARWSGQHAKVVNANRELAVASQIIVVVPAMLLSLNTAIIVGMGGRRIMNGALTMGALIAFQALSRCFLEPVNRLTQLGARLQEVQGSVRRLDDVLENELDGQFVTAPAGGAIRKLAGSVELRNVTFGYSRLAPPLISGLHLKIPAGSRVAIVGGSGSGKSTIGRLVSGLYTPWSGEILFDDVPRGQIDREAVVNSVASVDQVVTLFEGAIAENLRLWDDSIDDESAVRAARDAAIHEEIVRMPGAYSHRVEESGRNLSGGQRQRLEIARALAGNPRILILDEATSALDPETEQIVADNVRRRGCTCLIIAHRLSTVRDCDQILVLDHGKVVERGTHEELLRRRGAYARLVSEQ